MGELIVGEKRIVVTGATLRVDLSQSGSVADFCLDLETEERDSAGDRIVHASGRTILLPGYCRPAPKSLADLARCRLESTAEDPADYFELELGRQRRAIAPMTSHEQGAVLEVEPLPDGTFAVRYRGTFVAQDPAGELEDELVDAKLDVIARSDVA